MQTAARPPQDITGNLIVISAAACLALLAVACAFIGLSERKGLPAETDERIRDSRARADSIAALLDIFKVYKGHYPESLETLEHELGIKRDRPTVAHWEYSPSSDGGWYSILICDQLYWDCYPSYRLDADGDWHIDN